MSIFKNIVQKQTVETKQFNYSKNKMHLDFTVRVDIKNDMKDFRDLLLRAIEDIEEELKK